MEKNHKTIAALLTVHNRREKTLACLRNLLGQQLPEGCALEVFLTDDGCTDGTPEAVREQFPRVHIVCGDGTLYWNRGMYRAWEAAAREDYDYYLWLNDDTFPYSDMVAALTEAAASKHNEAIIVGPTQDTAHTRMTYGGRLLDGSLAAVDGTLREVDYFNGNIVLVPRKVFQVLGNLDRYFTHSKGDFDYGLRARKAGINIYQVGRYLGECDLHKHIDKWCDPAVPLRQRWQTLWRPNGMPPHETFHLEQRHKGCPTAAFHYITIILRCLLPQLWSTSSK